MEVEMLLFAIGLLLWGILLTLLDLGWLGLFFGILGFGMMVYEALGEDEEDTKHEGTKGPED